MKKAINILYGIQTIIALIAVILICLAVSSVDGDQALVFAVAFIVSGLFYIVLSFLISLAKYRYRRQVLSGELELTPVEDSMRMFYNVYPTKSGWNFRSQ